MPRNLLIALLLLSGIFTSAQDNFNYQTPPPAIRDLVLAPPTPTAYPNRRADWLVLTERSNFSTVAELARPELRIAGLRINPANLGPSRASYFTKIEIRHIASGQNFAIEGLPTQLRGANLQWNPSQTKFAFTHTTSDKISLYVVDMATKKAITATPKQLNAVMGTPFKWINDEQIVFKGEPDMRSVSKPTSLVPKGPVVQENAGKKIASRTYQDLIKNQNDEIDFEYYATCGLFVTDTRGDKVLEHEVMIRSFDPSPDGNYILLEFITKPFSYLVPAGSFPHIVVVMNTTGGLVRTLAQNPSGEGAPIGFDDVPAFPRRFNWRNDQPATISFVKALDGGLGKSKAAFRDGLYSVQGPLFDTQKELCKTKMRFSGVVWGNRELAIVTENLTATRRTRMSRLNPETGQLDSLYERSSNDLYNDIGTPMTTLNEWQQPVLLTRNNNELILSSEGATAKGDMPFIQSFNLNTRERKMLWRCEAPYFETVRQIIDPVKMLVLTSRESPEEPTNYFIRDLKKKKLTAITQFPNPYPQLSGITRKKIFYKRADGVDLTGDLYLPGGYDARRDGPLPVLIWAYPREYKSASDAAQVRGSQYSFTRIGYGSPIFWVTQGYAVLDNAEMPIVGENGKEPNDKFIPQLYLNAHAAIQQLASMGVGDSNRVAVGGHSYGAFMTANLLAHTNLFKAGIARSGAYNRTLTPFGFQSEERTYWEAPEVYNSMSPFNYADKLKTPLLLVHGEMDNNPGTFPIQSERMFNAVKGHGGTVRYVTLPFESHGYSGAENILHMLWEQNQWLEKYVKNPAKKGF